VAHPHLHPHPSLRPDATRPLHLLMTNGYFGLPPPLSDSSRLLMDLLDAVLRGPRRDTVRR